MKAFLLLLVVGLAAAAPTSKEDEDIVIDEEFYPSEWVKYTSEHDIVSLLVPINSLNFDENDSSESNSKEEDVDVVLFFSEADIIDGKKDYKGVSVIKKNKVTKLLENGRDMAASGDDSKLVFIGASDGIYVYKDEKTAVEKYGSINDDIYGIAKEKDGDIMYILTANKEVFKVSDNGNKKEKLEGVKAEQMVLDYSNNLYFSDSDKQVYVRTSEGIKKIEGLPANPKFIQLLRPAFVMDDMVPVVVDETSYLAYSNGTSETGDITFKKPKYRPTAYSMEAAIIQYYAIDKHIYEYNMLAILLGTMLEEIKNFLGNQKSTIEEISSSRKASVRKYV
ncbi:uncharacterized protein LOC121738092 [Aricia agestis]|uniref:uncharacterized protein LOC121738092 n=1 Tax=Aricia agestis TaxID=91739 RepID=UPI001C207098|nr:uncharacterized protein LOC121738092 [Aricia agestis]